MSNVVIFPRSKREGAPVQSHEELIEKVTEARKDHIEYLVDEVMSAVFQRCIDEGFDLTKLEAVKPTCLLVEAFRSALYGASGLEHPLQQAADQLFVEEANDNDDEVEEEIPPVA
jgi:hypothetical protein